MSGLVPHSSSMQGLMPARALCGEKALIRRSGKHVLGIYGSHTIVIYISHNDNKDLEF